MTLVDRTKIRLRNNEKGICPLCGSPVTIKARGRMPARICDRRIVSFIDPREEQVYIDMCFKIVNAPTQIHMMMAPKLILPVIDDLLQAELSESEEEV